MTPSEEYRLIPLTRGQFAIVDSGDYDFLMRWKWHAHWDQYTKSFYARRSDVDANGKRIAIQMHRVILGLAHGDKRQGDHENRNTLDDRRRNLRVATHSQNQANRAAYRNNKSGYKGVSWHKASNRWIAQIQVNRKGLYLGIFCTPEEAHAVYRAAAIKHHGEFARFA